MAETEHPRKAFGWAARDPSGLLTPFHFSRRFIPFQLFIRPPFKTTKYEQHYDETSYLIFPDPYYVFIIENYIYIIYTKNTLILTKKIVKNKVYLHPINSVLLSECLSEKQVKKMWHSKCCTVEYATRTFTLPRTNGALPPIH